jgi:hypothetical protein
MASSSAAAMHLSQQQQQQQPSTPARSTASASTSAPSSASLPTPPPRPSGPGSSGPPDSSAAALAHLRNAMLSWSAALTRLQPKCVVGDAARERGLRLLARFQRAVRLGEGLGAPPSPASSSSSSPSSAARPSPASPPFPRQQQQQQRYHGDFCSTPLPSPSPLTTAQVASALWIAIKAEGVRCAVPSRGLLARATGVAPEDLAGAELALLVALKFDVFLGDVLFLGGEDGEALAAGKENAMV